jgi:hypothetical protein
MDQIGERGLGCFGQGFWGSLRANSPSNSLLKPPQASSGYGRLIKQSTILIL